MRAFAHSVIVSFLVLLAACSSGPVAPPVAVDTLERDARSALERGDLLAARSAFEQLVGRTSGGDRLGFELELARIEIALGEAAAALARLDGIPPPVAAPLRTELMAVRADALFALGRPGEAVSLLVEREIWLDSPAAILANQTRIWNGLAATAPALALGARTGDSIIDGWLALAPVTGLTEDGPALREALIAWSDDFPNHPATAGILAEQLAALRGDLARPGRIALLLPLGAAGELRLQAESIRDGVFAAALSGNRDTAPAIQIIDTSGDVVAAYRAAQLTGVDFIVGPLRSEDVDLVLPLSGLVPTLALNVAGSANAVPASNFYQFSLSSDDEIEAIATQAIADGHETAVILHREDPRGRRLRDSFTAAFESRGGRVIDARGYSGNSDTLVGPIEQLLNITQSEARYTRLRENLISLGRSIEFSPRRRSDIDMIFLQADPRTGPEDARLLVPLLEGSNAANIPTYASSDVFDPAQTRSDADLNGLIIPELPMLVDPVGDGELAADLLARYTSRSAGYNRRLFAFGYDAYRLAERLFAGSMASWPLEGATGSLYLTDGGRVRRVLPLAEFVGGQLRPAGRAPELTSRR